MKRADVINKLAGLQLESLSSEKRKEQLECMFLEDWSSCEGWEVLPKDLLDEYETEEIKKSTESPRYNPMLLIWLKDSLAPVTNSFLIESLQDFGELIENIEGNPILLEACPCCGRRTLESRNNFEICPVCWWEDDGQDSEKESMVTEAIGVGGPNSCSLTQARLNFIKNSIAEPNRGDLIKIKSPPSKYELGRRFELSDNNTLIEVGTDWVVKIG